MFSIIYIAIFFNILVNQATANGPCGDWTSYHDQKCFKIIAAVGTQQEAMAACKQLDSHSTLPTIKSLDENTFIYNMVKPYASQATSIWLGTLYLSNTFQWVDHTAISYKNYAYPANIHNQCMQMSLHNPTLSQWTDEPCNRKSLIVCQHKLQQNCSDYTTKFNALSKQLTDAQTKLDQMTKIYNADVKVLVNAINTEWKDLQYLVKHPVPVGFIYVQLPNQNEPAKIWPTIKWQDISTEYAGLFFRAQGGMSAPFGHIQEAKSSRLQIFRTKHFMNLKFQKELGPFNRPMEEGKWLTPGDLPATSYIVNIYTSKAENRPVNTAVKVWKHIA